VNCKRNRNDVVNVDNSEWSSSWDAGGRDDEGVLEAVSVPWQDQ